MDPKETASTYADTMGVGPRDSSTLDKGQEMVSKGMVPRSPTVYPRFLTTVIWIYSRHNAKVFLSLPC